MYSRIRAFAHFSVFVASLLTIALPINSQTPIARQEPNRVLWPVAPGTSVQLEDRLPAYVRNIAPTGTPSSDTMLTNLMVLLSRSPQTQAAFDEFVLEQQNPSSPNFHHFLAPIAVGQRFGPTLSDVQAVASWLGTQGLQVDEVSPDMTRVVFHGTVANVSSAFNVQFGTFNLQTARGPQTRLASLSAPSIPMALSPVIQSVVGLYADPLVSYESGNEFPNTTNSHAMTPAAFNTQYSTTNILAAGYTGQGVRVAVLGYSRVLAPDITDFLTAMKVSDTYLNTAALPNQIVPPTGTDPGYNGNQAEQTLDVTRVMSTAPGSITDLVVSGTTGGTDGLIVDLNYEVNTLVDPILTMSYGGCETVVGSASVNTYAALFQTAVSEGITPMIAAGDSGAECGNAWATDTSVPTTPIVGVNWLCANSYVTCVGGTSLNDQPQVYVTPAGKGGVLTANITAGAISSITITKGGSGYSSPPTIRIDGGGGTGATATATLTGGVITGVTVTSGGSGYKLTSTYWNDTGTNFSTLLGVVPEGTFNDAETANGLLQVGGSTGGFSTFATRPAFQTTALAGAAYAAYAAAPFAGQRLVPDISVSADVHDGYFMCLNLDCENGNFRSEAGTSGASPGLAGIMALVVNRSGSQGWFNPTLYALASARYTIDFNDITSTSAGVATCSANVPSHCNNDEPYLDGSTQTKTAYKVGTGYDPVTGWGSVNAYNMLLDLRPPSPYNPVTYTTTTTTFHSIVAITYGTTLSTSLNATTSAGTTDVTAKGVEGYFSTISGGATVAATPATLLTPGAYALTAIWQPTPANAGTYNDSFGTASLTVNQATPGIAASAASSTVPNSTTADALSVTLTAVTNGATPTGTVQFYDGTTAIGSAVALVSGAATLTGQTFTTPGAHSLTAKYLGDTNYKTVTSSAFTVTVVPPVTVTATVNPTTIVYGGTSTLSATVTATSGTPTGTVQFYDGTSTVGSPVTIASGAASLSGQTFTTIGAHSITAKYSGDTNFTSTTSSATTLTVNKATPTATATAASSSVAVNGTDNLSITVASTAGTPTGTVQFYDGTTAIGSPVTLAGGAATLTGQTFTTAGAHSITAVYSGDANFNTATSAAIIVTVATPSLSLSLSGGSSITVPTPGSTGTNNLTVTSVGGATGTVTVSCTVAWTGAGKSNDLPTCVATPSSLTLAAGGTATSTITLTTIAAHGRGTFEHAGLAHSIGGGVLACLLVLFIPLRKKRIPALLMLLALAGLSGPLSGCSSHSAGYSDIGTSIGTYTVSVTATSGTLTSTSTFTITVN